MSEDSTTGKQVEPQPSSAPRSEPAGSNAASGPRQSLLPSTSVPKGGGAIRGLGEKYAANPQTGTGSLTVPIATSPGRAGFDVGLQLSYDSGGGQGPFGIGWQLSVPAVTRKTDKGLPRYLDELDTFVMSGAEDLVPIDTPTDAGDTAHTVQRYRPRVEGLFARVERWTRDADGDVHWRTTTRDNVLSIYGRSPNARIADPRNDRQDQTTHPARGKAARVFSWLLEETRDDRGNVAQYKYKAEDGAGVRATLSELSRFESDDDGNTVRRDGSATFEATAQRYLHHIRYANVDPIERSVVASPEPGQWLFEVVFDYGEFTGRNVDPHLTEMVRPDSPATDAPLAVHGADTWPVRQDPFSSYRAGFEVRTYRRCQRVMMFHRFPSDTQGLGVSPCLVSSTDFHYEESAAVSYLSTITQVGYRWDEPRGIYECATLPSLELGYSKTPSALDETVHRIDAESLVGVPGGVGFGESRWVDLDGEGLPGILTNTSHAWSYKANLGNGELTAPRQLPTTPVGTSLESGAQLTDLGGDGQLDFVHYADPVAGYAARTPEGGWEAFQSFRELPNIDWSDPNLRILDVDGDGHPDVLISEEHAFRWYRSRSHDGFEAAQVTSKATNEALGPAVLFSDASETIFVADMSGDGLPDIARIRNGEVCYWPNLGHAKFGRKVVLEGSPLFDSQDFFDPKRIRFADIDGSGTSDVLYLGRDGIEVFLNRSGNSLSARKSIGSVPRIDASSSLSVMDLLGKGTSCLVWSSTNAINSERSTLYIDPLGALPDGAQKPNMLVSVVNNFGLETKIAYAPSTKFYLRDKKDGRPWLTRLNFPVQVVERTETVDHINGSHSVTRYAYHHGYFDGVEREFRGFACVEQWDAESFGAERGRGLFPDMSGLRTEEQLPPVRTVSWFHTGAWLNRERLERELAKEYFSGDPGAPLLPDTYMPPSLTVREEQQAVRALRGQLLRQETYAEDGSPKASVPYSVTEKSYALRVLQPMGENEHAVVFSHAREALTLHYERNAEDPRIQQELTLEVDDYGNVVRSLALGYPRRETTRQQAEMSLGTSLAEQGKLWATISEAAFLNQTDQHDWYRVGTPIESAAWELSGYVPDGVALLTLEEAQGLVTRATHLPYESAPSGGVQRRLVEAQSTRYYSDALTPLPLGACGAQALPVSTYQLALTEGLVAGALDHDTGGVSITIDRAWLGDDCAYTAGVDLDYASGFGTLTPKAIRDGSWWASSGSTVYESLARARSRFFMPERAQDVFGNEEHVTYDQYTLLVVQTVDAAENTTTSEGDYRVLAPWQVTDANANRVAVHFDPLGMVTATALMGKFGAGEGDTLADPTSRVEYDLHRNSAASRGKASMVRVSSREQHGVPSRWQEAYTFFDGSGREVLSKAPAEPGPAPQLDASGTLVRNPDGTPWTRDVQDRWVGSGRVVYDNKGNVVRKYEPFFWDSPDFNDEQELVEWGVTPLLRYDPVGRVVRTDQPNGTFSKVEFDAWRQETWDENDTVLESEWYARRGSPAPAESEPRTSETNAQAQREVAERRAAWLAAHHAETPAVALLDSLGRSYLTIAHNRTVRGALMEEAKNETRVELDIEGNPLSVTDARGVVVQRQTFDVAGRALHSVSPDAGARWLLSDAASRTARSWDSRKHAFRYVFDAAHRPTHTFVTLPDGSERLTLRTVYGEGEDSAKARNLRGQVHRVYDGAGMVIAGAFDFKGNATESTRRMFDVAQSGYALPDNRLAPNWHRFAELRGLDGPQIDATPEAILEAQAHSSRSRFDALNRVVLAAAPDGSVTRSRYNEAGLLDGVDVWHRGLALGATLDVALGSSAVWQAQVRNIDYNERGQRLRVVLGTARNTETRYSYDVETFRLTRLQTLRAGEALQDHQYTYDAAGNIVEITNAAEQALTVGGERVEATKRYTYDAIYQLVEARGREHIGQTNATARHWCASALRKSGAPLQSLRHGNDVHALRTYTETYVYDHVGNILSLEHKVAGTRWRRRYAYEATRAGGAYLPRSNRLQSTSMPGDSATQPHPHSSAPGEHRYSARYEHDAHGNMTRMPHLPELVWDPSDRMSASTKQASADAAQRETTYYAYDASGDRVRKATFKAGALTQQREYLGGYEVYGRISDGLVRQTLHVMDDTKRVALIETNVGADSVRTRYQLDDHLGSSVMELSENAEVIGVEEYFPFGGTSYRAVRGGVEVSAKRYRYTGKERDEETGLYYYGARYYAAWLGRWTAADPAGFVDGPNVFVYVRNRPTLLLDRDGRSAESREKYLEVPETDSKKEALGKINDFFREKGVRVHDIRRVDGHWHFGKQDYSRISHGDGAMPDRNQQDSGRLVGSQSEATQSATEKQLNDLGLLIDSGAVSSDIESRLAKKSVASITETIEKNSKSKFQKKKRRGKSNKKRWKRQQAKFKANKNGRMSNATRALRGAKTLAAGADAAAKSLSIVSGVLSASRLIEKGTIDATDTGSVASVAGGAFTVLEIGVGAASSGGMAAAGGVVAGTAASLLGAFSFGYSIGGKINENLSESTQDSVGATVNELVNNTRAALQTAKRFWGGIFR